MKWNFGAAEFHFVRFNESFRFKGLFKVVKLIGYCTFKAFSLICRIINSLACQSIYLIFWRCYHNQESQVSQSLALLAQALHTYMNTNVIKLPLVHPKSNDLLTMFLNQRYLIRLYLVCKKSLEKSASVLFLHELSQRSISMIVNTKIYIVHSSLQKHFAGFDIW